MKPQQQSMTVIATVKQGSEDELTSYLRAIGGHIAKDKIFDFSQFPAIHFARWVVIPPAPEFGGPSLLALGTDHDGADQALLSAILANPSAAPVIDKIYAQCEDWPGVAEPDMALQYFLDRRIPYGARHIGARRRTVQDLNSAAAARGRMENVVDDKLKPVRATAGEALDASDAEIEAEEVRHAAAPIPAIENPPVNWQIPVIGIASAAALAGGLALLFKRSPKSGWASVGALLAIPASFIAALRYHEIQDAKNWTEAAPPSLKHLATLRDWEDHQVQNQMTHIVPVRPGLFRQGTLRGVLAGVNFLAQYYWNRGQLGGIPTIHFARWMLLDGGKRLLFFSNYDGSWENYLGDFIDRASPGLTGVWSNTEGFPPTSFLVDEGSRNTDAFKNWTRQHQIETQVWYSAYPDVSMVNQLDALTQCEPSTPFAVQQLLEAAPSTMAPPSPPSSSSAPDDDQPAQCALTDIQAIVLSAYGHLDYSAYLFLRLPRERRVITDAARSALRKCAARVTAARWEDDRSKRDKTAINIAFTFDGITALGHTSQTLGSFPPEFQSGMTAGYRSRALGDVKANDPSHWEYFGTAGDRPDVLLLCFADSAAALDATVAGVLSPLTDAGATVIADERGCPDMHNHQEHFGFRDSITSVKIAGGFGVKDPGQPVISPGEFILGYENEYGQYTPSPVLYPGSGAPGGDLGKNGAYLVYRKLRQHVPEFWSYCRKQAESLGARDSGPEVGIEEPSTLEFIGAKMVGRWRNGTPLTLSPFHHDPAIAGDPSKINDFVYSAEDADGSRCPFGAHIRRANPRDVLSTQGPEEARETVNHHRILRRGRAYGTPLPDPTQDKEDGVDRGLLFFCINADIARQFEFVQQTWMTDPKFAGLWNEPDPLIGSIDNLTNPGERGAEFTIPQKTVRIRLQKVGRFVSVRAGGYLFLPGISRLNTIIDPPAP